MQLPVRYQVMDSRGPDDNVEANIVHTAAQLELDVHEIAIVLVDTWAGHPMSSHLARTREISRTHIRPLLDAARAAGATVIYAPSPRVAPDFEAFRHDSRESAPPAPAVDDWPPEEYRAGSGRYRSLRKRAGEVPEGYDGPYPDWWHMRGIDEAIAPTAGDVVVATGAELHAACKARGLLHLIYAGFATNICIRFRDYGLRAMRDRGYSPILLRDATSAIETRATIGSLSLTRAVILDIERWFYTALTDDLIAAFGDA